MPELLAPAGNIDKLKFALHYGADAVYIGASQFSLRSRADNFSFEDLVTASELVHKATKKLYMAVNIYFQENDIEALPEFLDQIKAIKPDALIMSDMGAISYARKHFPDIDIHLSTQANATNSESVSFYRDIGIKRIVLARELSFDEIKRIRDKVQDIELETFVHGAMCIAYSGRCLISNYLTNPVISPSDKESRKIKGARIANKGDCSQSCRWYFKLVEENGPSLSAEEIDGGTYIMSSKDLCMVNHINEMINAGIDSFKIEGRVKSLYYVANTTRIYRHAIDTKDEQNPEYKKIWNEELDKISHREYCTGFFLPSKESLMPASPAPKTDCRFIAIVVDVDNGIVQCRAYNKVSMGDNITAIGRGIKSVTDFNFILLNDQMKEVDYVGHGVDFFLKTSALLEPMDILRIDV